MYNYPYGDTQQLNLDWFLTEFQNLVAAWEQEKAGIDGALDAEIAKAEAALADVFAARDAAATSAQNAATSAQNAATSASDASGYLATVDADATAARNAAQNASRDATAASGSAQAAAQSALNASGSAQNATTSAITATGKAAEATQANTLAQAAAGVASDKADAAAQSATDAETAATGVEESAAQITQNASDIADLKNAIDNLNCNKASAIYGNSSGEIASFNDGSKNSPVKITEISDNATKIFAFGYNLLLNEAQSGRYGGCDITINDDGTFTITNKTGTAWDVLPINTTPILLKAGTYTIAEYDGATANDSSALNVLSDGINILNTRYSKVRDLVLTQDTEIAVTFSVAYARINEPVYTLIVKGSVAETGITYNNIPQIYKKSVGSIVPPNTEIFSQDGVNNIWADNGQISVEYVVNTKMYIDNKIAELQATLLENIGG